MPNDPQSQPSFSPGRRWKIGFDRGGAHGIGAGGGGDGELPRRAFLGAVLPEFPEPASNWRPRRWTFSSR